CRRITVLYSCFFGLPSPSSLYTLSLHDALPIFAASACAKPFQSAPPANIMDVYATSPSASDAASLLGGDWWPSAPTFGVRPLDEDRKSTRLNSSHVSISYAVFCLKKKKQHLTQI